MDQIKYAEKKLTDAIVKLDNSIEKYRRNYRNMQNIVGELQTLNEDKSFNNAKKDASQGEIMIDPSVSKDIDVSISQLKNILGQKEWQ